MLSWHTQVTDNSQYKSQALNSWYSNYRPHGNIKIFENSLMKVIGDLQSTHQNAIHA